jgi:hypothetical protein
VREHAAFTQARHVARPGYNCDIGKRFENGVWANATLDSDGRQLKSEWEWRQSLGRSLLRLSVTHRADGPTPPTPDNAYASIRWATPKYENGPKLRLELTTDPRNRYWWAHGLATEYARGGGDRSLTIVWSDLVALSRGASSLNAVLRALDGTVMDDAPIDPTVISAGVKEIDETLRSLAEAKRDYRGRCQRVDDVDPEIVVT